MIRTIIDQRIDVELVIAHERALKKGRVPIGIAFHHEDANLLVDDVEIGDGAVVGGVGFVVERQRADFVFVLAGVGFGDFEFNRNFLKLLRVELLRFERPGPGGAIEH